MMFRYLNHRFLRRFTSYNAISVLLRFLKSSAPFLIASATLIGLISFHQLNVLLFLIMTILIVVMTREIIGQLSLPRKWAILLQVIGLSCLLSFLWLDYSATSASAMFFKAAEDFFTKTFASANAGANASQATALIFNVMRALYLLYIAVALVGVLNAVRRDEDWQVLARTPLLVVVAVTIADVMTSFIIG